MLNRVASRLLTGPVAFLVAGTLDLLGYWLGAARRAIRVSGPAARARGRRLRAVAGSSTISPR